MTTSRAGDADAIVAELDAAGRDGPSVNDEALLDALADTIGWLRPGTDVDAAHLDALRRAWARHHHRVADNGQACNAAAVVAAVCRIGGATPAPLWASTIADDPDVLTRAAQLLDDGVRLRRCGLGADQISAATRIAGALSAPTTLFAVAADVDHGPVASALIRSAAQRRTVGSMIAGLCDTVAGHWLARHPAAVTRPLTPR